ERMERSPVGGHRFHRWLAEVAQHRVSVLAGRWWSRGRLAVADLLFPPHCFLCGIELDDGVRAFCPPCHTALTSQEAGCPRCARPLPRYSRADSGGCLVCRRQRLGFDQAVAVGIYGGAVRQLVLRIKQARHESLCLAAGGVLAEVLRRRLADDWPDLIIPVPMHWSRRLLRGLNDAELLAEVVAESLQRPVRNHQVQHTRPTRKQGTLLPAERARNVRGAYRLGRKPRIERQHILLVDDVMTTGATASEISRVLRRGGARKVSVGVIARGVGYT
ncbi:MAG: ComF family protein, partial [Pirellulaceae bacterium]